MDNIEKNVIYEALDDFGERVLLVERNFDGSSDLVVYSDDDHIVTVNLTAETASQVAEALTL